MKQQAIALSRFQKLYRNGDYAAAILSPTTMDQLLCFAKQNLVVFGYMFAKFWGEDMNPSNEWTYADVPLFLEVEFGISNVQTTKKEVNSGSGVTISSLSKSSRVEGFYTLHGIRFDVTVTWTYKRGGTPAYDPIVWKQTITKEPYSHSPVEIPPLPERREFEIGALFHLAHRDTNTSDDTLRANMSGVIYPRHNLIVDKIMNASEELQRLVDFHAHALSSHANVADSFRFLEVPWSVHTSLERNKATGAIEGAGEEDGDVNNKRARTDSDGEPNAQAPAAKQPLVDANVFPHLNAFHASNVENILRLGPLSELLQKLYLAKMYAAHFSNCFNLIEERQVRAFLSGIGKANAAIWERRQGSIDRLLLRTACHTASQTKNGDPGQATLKACSDSFTACSFRLEVRFPGEGDSSVLHAVERRTNMDGQKDGHTIKFRGPGDEGVKVTGPLVRRVFVVPSERAGTSLPSFRLSGGSLFGQPVFVSIGAMGGVASNGKSLFLFGDGMQLNLTLSAAALPSNAAFEESMVLLPDEMQSFAKSVRAADLAESGFCIDVIEARPLLAQQLGIREEDLVGRRDKEQQLLNLVKAGAALAAVAATARASPSLTGAEYNLDAVFEQVDSFQAAVMKDGELDQKRKSEYSETMQTQNKRTLEEMQMREDAEEEDVSQGMAYRSVCSGCRSSGGGDVASATLLGGGDDEGDRTNDEGDRTNDVDVMGELLNACGSRFGKHDFSACKIDMGNPRESMQFAQSIKPNRMGGYVEPPPACAWFKKGAEADVMREALIDFLEKSSRENPVKATRIIYYGMYAHFESALLKSLLSGGVDPCKTHAMMFEVAQETLDKL